MVHPCTVSSPVRIGVRSLVRVRLTSPKLKRFSSGISFRCLSPSPHFVSGDAPSVLMSKKLCSQRTNDCHNGEATRCYLRDCQLQNGSRESNYSPKLQPVSSHLAIINASAMCREKPLCHGTYRLQWLWLCSRARRNEGSEPTVTLL